MRYLTEADVVRTLDMPKAMAALRPVLIAAAHGRASNVPKALATFGDGASMHALGAVSEDFAGFKTWVFTKNGGGSVFSLFDAQRGTLLAVIEARALGQLRTAAITGLATEALAPAGTRVAALVGTGAQAGTQLSALAAALPDLERVRVYSPTPERRAAFVARQAARFPFAVVDTATLDETLDGADVATIVTRAADPFLSIGQLTGCRHLNAVGAILPARAELSPEVLAGAAMIVVDDVPNARKASRELRELFQDDEGAWQSLPTLGAILADPPKPAVDGMTIFKPMGMGLSDLALAIAVHGHAEGDALGTVLPDQTRRNLLEEK